MKNFLLMSCLFFGVLFFPTNESTAQWVQANGPYGGDIRSFAVSPNGTGGTNLFAGTYGGGVFLSTNNGTSWTAVNTGLTNFDVSSFAVSSTDLFAGTAYGGGVWRRPLSEMITSVSLLPGEIPQEFTLDQNYPNPFNPTTRISWQSPVGSHQTIKVFDVLGNEIATLVNEYRPAGMHSVQFTINNLASGVYFYQLKVADPETSSGQGFIQTKKMLLIK